MRLWHIFDGRKPKSFGLFVNGLIEHPYGMPGLDCPGCDKWTTLTKLPIECPPEIRKEVEAVSAERPCMPWEHFERYRDRWEGILRQHGVNTRLEPGNDFWPTIWRTPSQPKYHFFWGIREVVVNAGIARLIEEHSITGAAISPVILKSCGTLDPDEPIPERILRRMADETDLFELCPRVDDPAVCGTFYSLLPLNSTYDKFVEEHESELVVCPICGSKEFPESVEETHEIEEAAYREQGVLPIDYSFPDDIFRSHIYHGGIVVSERFFRLLNDIDLQNCSARRLKVVRRDFLPRCKTTDVSIPGVAPTTPSLTVPLEYKDEGGAYADEVKAFAEQPNARTMDQSNDVQSTTAGQSDYDWSPMCFVSATADVGEAHKPVRWMLRHTPELETRHIGLGEMQFSGWLMMTSEEEGEEAGQTGMYYLKDIVKYDPAIIPYLTTPAPCRLERDGDLPIFYEVGDDD